MLKATIFREYDIRGVAESELRSADVELLGRALGTYLIRKAGKRVSLGRDCRLSSERLRNALANGLVACGCEVTDVGVVPTPLLYYSQVHLKSDGAVMITGSHNPPEYNGFKTVAGGAAIYGEQIQEIRKIMEAGEFERGQGRTESYDIATPYVDEITKQFHYDRRVKVVLDGGNGTVGPVMHRVLERLNVEATELYFDMDGRFPNHHPDPTVMENLEELTRTVKETGADLGLAFDGDADRLGRGG